MEPLDVIKGHRLASEWFAEHGFSVSEKSLLNMAANGTGPLFRKWGHSVIYRVVDLHNWAILRWNKPGGPKKKLIPPPIVE